MIKPEQVPKEVIDAFWRKLDIGSDAETIAAALNAWPGAGRQGLWSLGGPEDCLILPLTEKPDDKA